MLKTNSDGYRPALLIFKILFILFLFPGVLPAQNEATSGERVAVVNGVDIPMAEFEVALRQALLPSGGETDTLSDAALRAVRKEVLGNLIGRRLAYQESRRLGIEVDSNRIDREMERTAARFSMAADFEKALHGADLARDRLRVQFRQDIAIRLLFEEQVLQHVEVNDREVEA
ncbi:MAG: hypothetical protein GY697_04815, partial [Desulfobacterales bacterium]|nr:hypothetical protein [Desulfobacterales bacterium]